MFSGKFEGNDGDGKHVDLAGDPHVPGQLHLQLGRAAATEVTEGLTWHDTLDTPHLSLRS